MSKMSISQRARFWRHVPERQWLVNALFREKRGRIVMTTVATLEAVVIVCLMVVIAAMGLYMATGHVPTMP